MAAVRKIMSSPPLPLEPSEVPPDGELLSLEDRLAYLRRRRRRPDWWLLVLTTIGIITMILWLLAEAVGLFQSA